MQSSIIGSRRITCPNHHNQQVTHICLQPKCINNSTLCSQCLNQQMLYTQHNDHQKYVMIFEQGLDYICNKLKSNLSNGQKIYKILTAKSEYQCILNKIENISSMQKQLQQKINVIKTQIDNSITLLIKQYQKLLHEQKLQYFKILDCFKTTYISNINFMYKTIQPLINFNNTFKYYVNKNNLYLKMVIENKKKYDWINTFKKSINTLNQNLQNINYTSSITQLFNSATRNKFDTLPTWVGQENWADKNTQCKHLVKKIVSQWLYVPQIKNLQNTAENGFVKNYQANHNNT